ncbi:MAG: hypothetical protein WDW36_005464 [Sanguina aurantia]
MHICFDCDCRPHVDVLGTNEQAVTRPEPITGITGPSSSPSPSPPSSVNAPAAAPSHCESQCESQADTSAAAPASPNQPGPLTPHTGTAAMVSSPREPSDIFADNSQGSMLPQPFATTDAQCLAQCQQWINSSLSMAGLLSSKHQGVSVLQEAPDAAAATLNILHALLQQRAADADTKAALQGQLSKHRMDADCAFKKVLRLEGDIEQQHTSNASLMIKVRKLDDQGKAKDAAWLQKQQESVKELARLKSAVAHRERDSRRSERETADLRTQLHRRAGGVPATAARGAGSSSSCSPPRGGPAGVAQEGAAAAHGRSPALGRGSLPAQYEGGGMSRATRARSTPDEIQPQLDTHAAENEQLKEEIAALKGEMLLIQQQRQQQLLLVPAQQVRESGAPGAAIAWPTAGAELTGAVRAEAAARAADVKALQVSAEQLKVYMQRLAEKEQLLAMSRKALCASDALLATKAVEAAASAQRASAQQRLLAQLQGKLATLGAERAIERAAAERQAAALAREVRNLQLDLDVSLRRCTAAEEEGLRAHSRVLELEAVNSELRSLLERSRQQQQQQQQRYGRHKELSSHHQLHFEDPDASASHPSPSDPSSAATSPPQPDTASQPDHPSQQAQSARHHLRASMTCLPNPLYASPHSSSHTPFASHPFPPSAAAATHTSHSRHPTAHQANDSSPTTAAGNTHSDAYIASGFSTLSIGAVDRCSSTPRLPSSACVPPCTQPPAPHTCTEPYTTPHRPPPPATCPPTTTTTTTNTTNSNSNTHPSPRCQRSPGQTWSRTAHTRGGLSASGRRMWEVMDPLLQVTPRQLLTGEMTDSTAGSRSSASSGEGGGSSVQYSLDCYVAERAEGDPRSRAGRRRTVALTASVRKEERMVFVVRSGTRMM